MTQDQAHPGNTTEHLGNERLPTHSTPGLVEQHPPPPEQETNGSIATPGHYWRLFTDPGLLPPGMATTQPSISTEAFLSLAHQVQVMARMVQTIVPLAPLPVQLSTLPLTPQRELPPPCFHAASTLSCTAPGPQITHDDEHRLVA